jgi:hypothetical protein
MLLEPLAFLLVIYWLVLTILAPGWTLLYLFGARIERPAASIFAALALGTALQPMIALVLDATFGISQATILGTSVGMSMALTLSTVRRRGQESFSAASIRGAISHKLSWFEGLFRKPVFVILCTIVLVTIAVSWYSALGVHSVDIGWHVYWARTIVDSSRLPNYGQIEPFDQASRFTFGVHYLMASLALSTGLQLTDIFWVIPLLYGTLTLLGLYVISVSITHNSLLGLIVVAIVASSFQSGGYIERGNLSDIVGYFMASFTFWLVIEAFSFDWHAPAICLSLLSVINYHQLGFIIVSVTLATWLGMMALFKNRELRRMIRANFVGRRQAALWTATVLAGIFVVRRTTYLNPGGFNLLVSSNWIQYVPTLQGYVSSLGLPLLLFGVLGLLAAGVRRSKSDLVIIAWVFSLLVLSNSPRFGLSFEPYRFMWRMVEPLALGVGIGVDFFVSRLESVWTMRSLKVKWLEDVHSR